MTLNSNTIVNDLHRYLLLLNGIEEQEQRYLEEIGKNTIHFQKSISLSYKTVIARLNSKLEGKRFSQHYFECSFKIEDQKVLLTDLKCENSDRENFIRTYIIQHITGEFPSTEGVDIFGKETARYLTIADEIAKQAYLCSPRDDYYPGYYSEIIIEDSWIILKQINHWNSRSLNHKDDYHLRNLEFYIPIDITEPKDFFQADKIGKMIIHFSDRSSRNNKICGEHIFQKMQEQKLLFKNG